jgi:streptogramin lyase
MLTNGKIAPRRSLSWSLAALAVVAGGSILKAQYIYEVQVPTTASGPGAITAPDPSGIELFAEISGNKIGFFQGSFTFGNVFAEYPINTANSQPAGITIGPAVGPALYSAWFTEFNTNKIGQIVYTPGCCMPLPTINEFTIPTANSLPFGITLGPDGALWFTENGGNKIGRITTAGAFTEYPIPTATSGPQGIAAGPDGALWFAEHNAGKIGRITTAGVITEFVLPFTPGLSAVPASITTGSDGALWFTENGICVGNLCGENNIGRITTSGAITKYPVPTANSAPTGITSGVSPDTALWFTEESGNNIGRITPAGWIQEFPVPTTGSAPLGISTTTNNVLITENAGNNIGLFFLFETAFYPGACTIGNGVVTVAYSATCTASTGGQPTYTWTATGLPPGLAIDPATGNLSGTPTTAGAYMATITVTDSGEPTQSAVEQYPINIYPKLTLACAAGTAGVVGTPYASSPCTAGGGDTPNHFTATGLPPGLSINANTGAITGTPTTAGPYTATVTVTDSLTPTAQTASQPVTIVIFPKLILACAAGTPGVVGTAYASSPCVTSAGDPPYAYTATGLPPGLSINSATGAITGTPTTAGSYTATVTATDSLLPIPQTASQPVTIVIYTTLTLSCAAGTQGVVGTAYASSPCTAAGGDSPFAYSATGLPPGLAINSATGAITGTPTTAGTYPVSVTATDSLTPTHQTASQPVTIVIFTKLTLSCNAAATGIVGTAYSSSPCTAAGGNSPYAYSATGLPPGLSINAATGAITGTPTAAAPFAVTVTVTDSVTPTHQTASQPVTITIFSKLILNCGPGGQVIVGTGLSSPCSAAGGVSPYVWAASGLPPGVSISSSTGQITGAPTAAGTFLVIVTVVDSTTPTSQTSTQQFSVLVIAKLNLICGSSAAGTVGVVYSTGPCSSSGGTPPYIWSASSLPPGLSIDANTGTISGTPTLAGLYAINVSVNDSAGSPQGASQQINILINPTKLTVTCGTVPQGTVGTAYSLGCSASGGTPPYVWSGSGLPPGLSVNSSTGAVGGSPTTAGSFTGSVTVTDSTTPTKQTLSQPVTIVINPNKLTITCASAAQGMVGAAYTLSCSASGGTVPYAFSGSGLPPGLSVDPATGAVTGTPTTAGSFTASVTVTDSTTPTKQTQSQPVTILILPTKLTITCGTVPQGTVGTAYSLSCSASGGTLPYTFSGSGLPPGLSVNSSTGAVSGTPTTAGSFTGSVMATDSTTPTKQTLSQPVTILINATKLIITCGSAPSGVVGTSYSAAPCSASGGTLPYAWSGSGLPAGLSVDPGTGTIAGTPTAAGSPLATVIVTDSTTPTKQSQSQQVTVAIVAAVTINNLNLTLSSSTNPPQSSVNITLSNPTTDALTAVLCMTIKPDPAVVQPPSGINPYDAAFANANAAVLKQCPAGAVSAISFALGPNDPLTKTVATVSQGTVAGQISLTLISLLDGTTSVLPTQNTSTSLTIPAGTPQITSAPVIGPVVNGSFTVSLSGYTVTRQLTEADFTFTPSTTSGSSLNNGSTPVTLPVMFNGADQTQWFQTAASAGLGGNFSLKVAFPYSGDPNALGTVSVVLKNNLSK